MDIRTQSVFTRRSFIVGGAACAAVTGAALSGCSGQSSQSASSASSASGSASSSGSGEASSEGAAPVKELTGACGHSSSRFNPIGNTTALATAAMWHVFEGLYDLDLHTYKTYNALAASEPEKISDTEYRVTLRDEAKFSNGAAVSANDVVNAFTRNMENPTYKTFLAFLDSVEALDEKTVALRLKYPFESLLKNRLSLVKVFPAWQAQEELDAMPLGTGPWKYDEINGNDGGKIVFSRNPHYNGMLPAAADTMRWSIMLEGADRTAALKDGSVQAIEDVPVADMEKLQDDGATIESVLGFSQAFLMFNCLKAPFNDVRVRQAFFYAIDVEKLISNVMAGHARAVTGFLPKTSVNYHQASTVYTYDPDKARALLAEAGVENLEFEMMTSNTWVKDLASQIQDDLANVGITMVNKEAAIDWAALAPVDDAVLPFDVMLAAGDPSYFGNDPDLLLSWWYGDNVWTQGRSCWAKSGDMKFEELQLLLQQAREATGTAQQDLWNKCFDLVSEEVPLYALFHREHVTGFWNSQVSGFDPIGTSGLVYLGVTPMEK